MNTNLIHETHDSQVGEIVIDEIEQERLAAAEREREAIHRFEYGVAEVHRRMRQDDRRWRRRYYWCLALLCVLLVLPEVLVWLATR